jgi:hypothetical protein
MGERSWPWRGIVSGSSRRVWGFNDQRAALTVSAVSAFDQFGTSRPPA